MEKNYDIDKHIGNSLKDFSLRPATGSFAAVMEKLERKKKRKRIFILLYSGFGTVAAILLAIFIFNKQAVYSPVDKHLSDKAISSEQPQHENKTVTDNFPGQRSSTPQLHKEKIINNPDLKNEIKTNATEKDNAKQKAIPPKSGNENNGSLPTGQNKEQQISAVSKIVLEQQNSKKHRHPSDKRTSQEVITLNINSTETKSLSSNGSIAGTKSPTLEGNPNQTNSISATEKIAETNSLSPNESIAETKSVSPGEGFRAMPETFFLPQIQLSHNDSLPDATISNQINTSPLADLDLLTHPVKPFQFLLGVNFNPQISRFALSDNTHRDPVFNTATGTAYSNEYLRQKKQMNKPYFSYAFGIKVGVAIRNTWEIWLGVGDQKIQYYEKSDLIPYSLSGYSGFLNTFAQNTNNADPNSQLKVTYNYAYYGAEIKRMVQVHPFLKLNLGLGVRMDHWYSLGVSAGSSSGSSFGYYDTNYLTNLSSWVCRLDLKCGVIYDLGARWQMRLSPGIFYSPTSVFDKNYVIKQKSYGLELEAMLAFKLFKD